LKQGSLYNYGTVPHSIGHRHIQWCYCIIMRLFLEGRLKCYTVRPDLFVRLCLRSKCQRSRSLATKT